MNNFTLRAACSILLLTSMLCLDGQQSDAYTPEDPVVKNMVGKAIQYLNSAQTAPNELVLVGYTLMKENHNAQNPVVQKALAEAQKYAAKAAREHTSKSNYEAAISALLFCEVDVDKYRSELNTIVEYFNRVQPSHGGYTYPAGKKGDTSQTQYVILALWTLDIHDFSIDYSRLQLSMNWQLRVQDPTGGFPYQGERPAGGQLIKQHEVTESMGYAGGSILLIGGDVLGMWGDTKTQEDPSLIDLPKAIKEIKIDPNAKKKNNLSRIPNARLVDSCRRMEGWQRANNNKNRMSGQFYYYSCYTEERYQSFSDIAQGQPIADNTPWYNRIVDELRQKQSADGSWLRTSGIGAPANTCFAVLALIRSTKKALNQAYGSDTQGGYGFGKDVSNSTLTADGKATQPSAAQSMDNMLKLLEASGADKLDGQALAENMKLSRDPKKRANEIDQMERILRGSQSYQARRVAARVLGTADSFDVVPTLIYALSDPDQEVPRFARDSLRFISRKFEGFDMPDVLDEASRLNGELAWQDWYKTVRPDYEFTD